MRVLYRNFNFHGWLDSSVSGKKFWLKEFYNQFDDEKFKTLFMQRLTVQEDSGFLRMYESADLRKRDYGPRLAERIAQEKIREEGK